ncbi:MAG: N-6 DNA methylase [Anaerolineae bacterium]|nr:N-6 DNA methylase [Anaerolineae bacterium]
MLNEHDAKVALKKLIDKYHALDPARRDEMTETDVVHQFITPLLGDVLGWPVGDPERYQFERRTEVGRPDITLTLDNSERVFVEAKRFGVLKELAEARTEVTGVLRPTQLALPGMAMDRTAEEQQAINYAFSTGGTWAILTNFERLRLFNARRDWLVFSFEKPDAYKTDFDLLWQLTYPNMLKGSLDRLSNQRYTRDVDTEYLALITDWRQALAKDILADPDANPWAFHPDGGVNLVLLRAVVQRFLDRLVVVRFAEDHSVIDAGTLRRYYELCRDNDYAIPLGDHLAHFFRQFDKHHNSALFAHGTVDEAQFSQTTLMELIATLYDARYRAMPPDIIGNTYEQYLGQTLALDNGSVETRDNVETRKKQGSYYTPHVIVQYIVAHSLGRYLYGTTNGQPDGASLAGETRKTSRDITGLRVLDSACGSGSFLIEAYQVLARFYEGEIRRLENAMADRAEALAAEGLSPIERIKKRRPLILI